MPSFDIENPLHMAVECRYLDQVKELLSLGEKIDARTRWGITPLMVAAEHGFDEIVSFLISSGADVNLKSRPNPFEEGRLSVLSWACRAGYLHTAQILIQHGADPNGRSLHGHTPLHWACHANNLDLVHLLVQHGADVNASGRTYGTPLMTAALYDRADIMRFLLESGADPNRRSPCGDFPLISTWALDCTALLLDYGANVNLRDANQATCLMRHIQVATVGLVQRYIQAGIDVNASDKEGHTALMLLTNEPRVEIAETLINAGANVNAVWRRNMTVLDYIARDTSGLASRRVRRKELSEFFRKGVGS
jgi:ankyrin